MGKVTLDQKYRIVLDRKTRDIAGVKKGDKLVAVPFRGGVILVAAKGRKFEGSLAGFDFVEEKHEASRYIFRRKP